MLVAPLGGLDKRGTRTFAPPLEEKKCASRGGRGPHATKGTQCGRNVQITGPTGQTMVIDQATSTENANLRGYAAIEGGRDRRQVRAGPKTEGSRGIITWTGNDSASASAHWATAHPSAKWGWPSRGRHCSCYRQWGPTRWSPLRRQSARSVVGDQHHRHVIEDVFPGKEGRRRRTQVSRTKSQVPDEVGDRVLARGRQRPGRFSTRPGQAETGISWVVRRHEGE